MDLIEILSTTVIITMRKYLFIFSILSSVFVTGQPSSFVVYPGSPQLVNHAHGVHQAQSGTIYLAGYGEAMSGTFSLISFTKFDESGFRIFTKYFGDSVQHFMMMRMLVIDDNNFIIAGSKNIFGGNYTPYAMKIDSNGIVIWEKTISSTINSYFTGVTQFANGNLVFSGATSDTINGDLNLTGVITDPFGNDLHSFSFGEIGISETSENCVVTDNGTILVCGDRLINTSIVNPYVVAFDSTGNFLWELGISSHNNSGSKNLYLDQYGSLLVIGESATDSSPQFDIQFTKIDISTASINWMKLIPGTDMSDAGFAISETADGNYAITGYGYDSTTSTKRVVFVVTDSSGNELSKKYFGNSSINIGYAISPSIYGGFLIAGADFVFDRQIMIYQKELGIGIDELNEFQNLLFPNPLSENRKIKFQLPIEKISISDISGKNVFSKFIDQSEQEVTLPQLPNGFYFVRSSSQNKNYSATLIICE